MDLMRLLRSLEEFLYELVGWLVFYPRTLWRVLRHPGAIARYTRMQLENDADRQFQDTISPVLMLILSVVLAHAMELGLRQALPPTATPLGQLLFGSEQALLLTRSAVFCIYALGAALSTLHQQRSAITRDTLRMPFSVQAFLVCPFVVLFSLGELLMRHEGSGVQGAGLVLAVATTAWYLFARTAAYRALYRGGRRRIFSLVCAWFVLTTAVILGLGSLLLTA